MSEKNNTRGMAATITSIGAILTGIGALLTAFSASMNSNNSKLTSESTYNTVRHLYNVDMRKLAERIAVLESTCGKSNTVSAVKPECTNNQDCTIGHMCRQSKCVPRISRSAPPSSFDKRNKDKEFDIPTFEHIQQTVQTTGKAWKPTK